MITRKFFQPALAAMAMSCTLIAQTPGAGAVSANASVTLRFAESVYDAYAEGTNGGISIAVVQMKTGPLKDLAGKPFSSILTVPSYRIESDQMGTKLNNVRSFIPADPQYGLHDMGYTVDRFDQFGLPMADGVYRLLYVKTTIGTTVTSHQALEFCWSAEKHCAVLDPVITFMQSKAELRQDLTAQHWGPVSTFTAAPIASLGSANAVTPDSGVCQLTGHPGYVGWGWNWAAWTQKYKDVFGITLVTKYLGQQTTTVACDTSCRPHASSFSATSSGSGSLGYSVACDNTGSVTGTTGGTARSIAETKCTHEFAGSAKASVTIKGSGSGISASWSTNGGVDSNGGVYTDSCARY